MSTPSDVTYLSKPVVMCSFASYFIVSSISHSFMIAYDSFHLLKSSRLNAGSSILKKLHLFEHDEPGGYDAPGFTLIRNNYSN